MIISLNEGTLLLEPGSPGYIINSGLFITTNGTTITSSGAPYTKATLIGGPNLSYPIIQTSGVIFDILLEKCIFLLFDRGFTLFRSGKIVAFPRSF